MNKEEVLTYLKELECRETRLGEGEFTTGEYAESEGVKMGTALRRLKAKKARGILMSRIVETGSTRTCAWRITDQKAQKGKGEKKK